MDSTAKDQQSVSRIICVHSALAWILRRKYTYLSAKKIAVNIN